MPNLHDNIKTKMAAIVNKAYLLTFTYIFTFLKFLICIHAGASRVPPRVLASGPKPRGGKNQAWYANRGLLKAWNLVYKQNGDWVKLGFAKLFLLPVQPKWVVRKYGLHNRTTDGKLKGYNGLWKYFAVQKSSFL